MTMTLAAALVVVLILTASKALAPRERGCALTVHGPQVCADQHHPWKMPDAGHESRPMHHTVSLDAGHYGIGGPRLSVSLGLR
jgi:hypothetical protein